MGEMPTKSLSTPTSDEEKKSSFYSRKNLRRLLQEARQELRKNGIKGLFRRYGWKLVALLFAYYLVRDVTIYMIIPWLIAKHLLSV